jgi:ABC-type transport system substrate-binding protein
MWHSSQRLAGSNFAGYQNPVADQLLTTARLQGDPEPRFAALSAFQHLWAEDTPSVVLTSPIMTYVMSTAIHGVQLGVVPDPGARFQHIAEWYVRTQRIPVLS